MSRKRKKDMEQVYSEDVFVDLKERFGIDYSFFADRLGIGRSSFEYIRKRRGLTSKEARILQTAIDDIARFLRETKIPPSMLRENVQKLRKKGEE